MVPRKWRDAPVQPGLDPAKLVFLDESGFRLGSPPVYGWAPLGEQSPGKSTHGPWHSITMIGAIALNGWRGFITVNAPTDCDVFLAFDEAVAAAMAEISLEDVRAWARYAGYNIALT